jgi:type I restriction enzyme M protein
MSKIAKDLWAAANALRGTMDPGEYKNYILGFFFLSILSQKVEETILLLEGKNIQEFQEYSKTLSSEQVEAINAEIVDEIGFNIPVDLLFSSIVKRIALGHSILSDVQKSFLSVESSAKGTNSENDFSGIFEDVDLNSSKLGATVKDKNTTISNLILVIANANLSLNNKEDSLGDIYEYLIAQFAGSAGKKGGEFFTPPAVSILLSELTNVHADDVNSIYDPTCGSGGLLLKAGSNNKNVHYYGQELNHSNYNMARMNMFIKGVDFNNYHIFHGNTLTNDMVGDTKFDVIVANPPYSAKWEQEKAKDDPRFDGQPLAPNSKADYAFVQHMMYHLKETGRMAVVLPLGVLFRGNTEADIRKNLIEKDYIEAVIHLPSNIFYGTSIPTVIVTFKKCKEESMKNKILFIDAKNMFVKSGTKNEILESHISEIISIYKAAIENNVSAIDAKKANISTKEDILAKDAVLNVNTYIDNFEKKSFRDIPEIFAEIESVEESKRKNMLEIKELLKSFKLIDGGE